MRHLIVSCALLAAACSPIRIKLEYGSRPPSTEHAGRVAFGTLDDQRRNTREVAPDVSLVGTSPSVPETMEKIVREGLAAAGFEVAPSAPYRVDAHLHTAWAQATFYRVQANLQLTVDLVEIASGQTVWTHRFGTVESSGGSDARSNYQAAYKRALSKLAGEVADALAASTFAEAMEPRSREE